MLTQTKLIMTVVGKSGSADLVSLSSNGTDIATHLLSNGLVEYEKQRNRNKFGSLVSFAQERRLLLTLPGFSLFFHYTCSSRISENCPILLCLRQPVEVNLVSFQMSTYEAAMTDAKKNRRNRFQYGDFTQDDAKEFGFSK